MALTVTSLAVENQLAEMVVEQEPIPVVDEGVEQVMDEDEPREVTSAMVTLKPLVSICGRPKASTI